MRCKKWSRGYTERSYRLQEGVPLVIDRGTNEENIVPDWMEQGLGFRNTTRMVNKHRDDEGKAHIGYNAVRNVFI